MFTKLNSAAPNGLDCVPVDVEVDVNKGQTNFTIIGLGDTSIKEARERVYSAMKNSGFDYPYNFRILINLAPADLNKEGPMYDLPMAVGLVAVSQDLDLQLNDAMLVGELALDGSLRHTNGILPLTIFAKDSGLQRIFVPAVNAAEAGLVEGIAIYPVNNLKQIMEHFTGVALITPYERKTVDYSFGDRSYELDMSMIKGQEFAKRALEIAASGNHNLLMSGPPGSGKTLLARTTPSILPRLSFAESLEITKIYSIAGILTGNLISERPFRSPHHSASAASLVGGSRIPRPGEISLAHRGVLYLDELPEFPRAILESLRQPLEDGVVTIARAKGTITFPARFILIASKNPCPCGYASDPERACTCATGQVLSYKRKISGPLMDRIDLCVEVPRLHFDKLSDNTLAESSAIIRERVEAARDIQNNRFKKSRVKTNGEMGNKELKEHCQLDTATMELLKNAATKLCLSARGYSRILKISRTIADLAQSDKIQLEHLAEALQYRPKTE
ncbi:MAG: YifB family Mg chelatase-like AAA ATPase [bacterium]|nr:YifB family Mg chelatase-like AAA ATPase [bacterium]